MGWDVGAKLFRSSSEAVGGSAQPRIVGIWSSQFLLWEYTDAVDGNPEIQRFEEKPVELGIVGIPSCTRVLRIRGGAGLPTSSTVRPYLEDHPGTSRWWITMVMVSFRPRFGSGCGTGPFQLVIESFMYPDHHLLAEMIFQIISSWWFRPKLKNISQIGNLSQIGMNIKNIWNHQLDMMIAEGFNVSASRSLFDGGAFGGGKQIPWSLPKKVPPPINRYQIDRPWISRAGGFYHFHFAHHFGISILPIFFRGG